MSYEKIRKMLRNSEIVVLDGGFGTELARRRVPGIHDPHIWSARGLMNAPRVVLDVHRDYVIAGADVITAGAFRTNSRALRKAGLDDLSCSLSHFAVDLAREMKHVFGKAWVYAVAGNLTSVEDCYESDVSPGKASYTEHLEKTRYLLEAGCDLILIETMPNLEEAATAVEAAADAIKNGDIPIWLSLALAEKGQPRVRDNTPVAQLPAFLRKLTKQPEALLFNCIPPEMMTKALEVVKKQRLSIPIGVYANVERPDEPGAPWIRREDMSPQKYAEFADKWIRMGARIVGGCCGTTPDDIRAIRERIGWRPRRPL